MAEPISLIPVRQNEIALGKPLRWAVYDWHGKLLLASGSVVETQSQMDSLIANGFFHDKSWDTELASSRAKSPLLGRPNKSNSSKEEAALEEESKNKDVVMDMDDVHWFVGETLYLQLHDNAAMRYTVKLIGFVKNKTVFVTAPTLAGKFEFVRDGQTFVVRAFSGKNAYAFTASAVKSIHTPHPYLLLSYPKQVRCTVVRQGARAEVKIIAAVTLDQPERMGATMLTDLSMGGASGSMKELLGKKGEEGRIKFKVHVADQDEFLNLAIVLRSVLLSENGDGFKYGFEFVDVSAHEKMILSAFVHQTLVEMT
jgi:c-di-GMP-binding flagellar brake protein YcgR